MKIPLLSRTLLALGTCIVPSVGFSQNDDTDEDDIFVLDAFSVTSEVERGYGASIAPTASRMNVPLEDLPMNVNVMSADFLNEINDSDTQNVLSWNASISGGRNSDVRGFGGNAFFVDGHQFNIWYPTAYIDRVEIVKGPASMWVGRTNPGGTINYIRNKAIRGVNSNQLKIGWGDVNGMPRYHLTLDSNYTVNDKLALRVIADYAEREDNTMPGGIHTASEHSGTRAGMLALSANYRFNQKTDLKAGFFRYESNIKSQDGRHTARGARISFNEDNLDMVPASSSVQVAAGSDVPVNLLYPNDIDQFEDFGWGRNFPIQSQEIYFDLAHVFSPTLVGHLKGNSLSRNMGHRDANGVSGGFVDGEPVVRETWFADDFSQNIPDVIGYLQWEPELGESRQIFTGGFAWNSREENFINYNNFIPGTDQVYTRHWFFRDEDHTRMGPPEGSYSKTARFGNSRDVVFKTINANWYGQFNEGRLNLMAGLSTSNYNDDTVNWTYDITFPEEIGDPTLTTRRETAPRNLSGSSTNPSVGALWKVDENWSVFGQWSTSLDVSTATDGFGQGFDPVFSKGLEAGIKVNTDDGKIRGTIAYFNIKQDDTIAFDPLANNTFYQATVDAGMPDESLRGASVQSGSITGAGVEVDLQLNLTDNWFANVSYANYFDRKITDDPIASKIGQTINGHIPYTIALYNKYRFTSGALEGLQVGGGVVIRAEQERTLGNLQYRDEGFKTFDLNAQYHMKHSEKVNTVIQVTLRNITEEKNFYTGWDAVNQKKFALENPMIFWVDYKINF